MPRIKSRPYEQGLHERLRSDPGYALEYIKAAAEDSVDGFLLALRDVANANTGMTQLAKTASLNRENLYRILSEGGNPRLDSLWSVLDSMGLRFTVAASNETSTPASEGRESSIQGLSSKQVCFAGGTDPREGFMAIGGRTLDVPVRKGPHVASTNFERVGNVMLGPIEMGASSG